MLRFTETPPPPSKLICARLLLQLWLTHPLASVVVSAAALVAVGTVVVAATAVTAGVGVAAAVAAATMARRSGCL